MIEHRPRIETGVSRARQSGMGMIEVLVALLVLAIGLFGVLSMQTKGLQMNQAGYYQSQAMFLAQDIIERIRANRGAALDYYNTLGTTPALSTNCETDTATCTPQQMATSDLYYWVVKGVQNLLPSGEGQVIVTSAGGAGGLYQVDIQIKYVIGKLGSGGNNYYTYQLSAKI